MRQIGNPDHRTLTSSHLTALRLRIGRSGIYRPVCIEIDTASPSRSVRDFILFMQRRRFLAKAKTIVG